MLNYQRVGLFLGYPPYFICPAWWFHIFHFVFSKPKNWDDERRKWLRLRLSDGLKAASKLKPTTAYLISRPSHPLRSLDFNFRLHSGLHPWIMQRFSDMDVSPGQELAISSKVNDDWIWGWISSGDQSSGTFSCLKDTHDGSMVLLYMVTWIPSIYPLYVSIYTIHGSHGIGRIQTCEDGLDFAEHVEQLGLNIFGWSAVSINLQDAVGAIFMPFIPNVVNPIVSLPFGDVVSFNQPFNSYPWIVMLRRDGFYHWVYTT